MTDADRARHLARAKELRRLAGERLAESRRSDCGIDERLRLLDVVETLITEADAALVLATPPPHR